MSYATPHAVRLRLSVLGPWRIRGIGGVSIRGLGIKTSKGVTAGAGGDINLIVTHVIEQCVRRRYMSCFLLFFLVVFFWFFFSWN
jgi:hypothetical protein